MSDMLGKAADSDVTAGADGAACAAGVAGAEGAACAAVDCGADDTACVASVSGADDASDAGVASLVPSRLTSAPDSPLADARAAAGVVVKSFSFKSASVTIAIDFSIIPAGKELER